MYTLGMDLGASSVKLAAIAENGEVILLLHKTHNGSPIESLKTLLDDLGKELKLSECSRYLVTGSSGELLKEYDEEIEVFETIPALVQGTEMMMPKAASLIGIGGQNACFITGIGEGKVPSFAVNESCASGTGGFFEDQMGRLGLKIEDYSAMTKKAGSIPRLSGRCAVFAKTDIIHRQQEGVPVEDILLGLCYAMVRSYKAAIVRDLPIKKPIALSGGVVKNEGVIRALKDVFELSEDELLYSDDSLYVQAVGAAREAARRREQRLSLAGLRDALNKEGKTDPIPSLKALPKVEYIDYVQAEEPHYKEDGSLHCFLGIDVGSTSTNLVLLDEEERLIDYQYLRTMGNPKAAVQEGLDVLKEKYGDSLKIIRTGVTGSGRTMIGKWIGAETVRDEITAQARSAVKTDPEADTVFEIGGQDSKYISIENGRVKDFQMNKICAAGTGSFVEEQAKKLGIELSDYGPMALAAKNPVDLGERCTVFVESAIHASLARGARKEDVAAGLCLSVIRNYLHKVVGTRKVGEHIVLQGGVAYNAGIVAAFRAFYGDKAIVSPYFPVSGAVGVALLALEERRQEMEGRQKHVAGQEELAENYRLYAKTKELFLENYDGKLEEGKKTVGIPRCLMMHKLFPMANGFFTSLGFQVLLSDETDENIIKMSQQTARGEFCYPVKLIHGHFKQLADAGVDYIFMPSMRTIRHVSSKVAHNYACPYMQTAPHLVAKTLGLEERGIKLLSPLLDLDFGQEMLAEAMLKLGTELGKTQEETALAMLTGAFAVNEFTRKTEELGEELMATMKPGEKALVLVTRNYGIEDPALNMDIPNELLKRGYKILTLSQLHAHSLDISAEYPGLYWPFGQHILSGAKIIRETPGLYAVYLTNHGCGPDTMISHLFREAMDGKPYLQIEVDEHFSKVGVITRIEAFLNSLESQDDEKEYRPVAPVSMIQHLEKERAVGIPSYGRYSEIFVESLKAKGYDAHLILPDTEALEMGRGETTSKEYYTFTMLLGMSLKAAGRCPTIQLMLPASEGADADGQYWRIIRAILNEKGYGDVKVIPLVEEQLTKPDEIAGESINHRENLFLKILEGDLYYMAPAQERETLFAHLHSGKTLGCEEIKSLACEVRKAWENKKEKHTSLGIVGEWPLVYEDAMNNDFWKRLESRGYHLYRMPLSEYLYFMWKDEAFEEERLENEWEDENLVPGMTVMDHSHCACGGEAVSGCTCGCEAENEVGKSSDDTSKDVSTDDVKVQKEENAGWLSLCEERMKELHEILGEASAFSGDYVRLFELADDKLLRYAGAGGRYRYAKAMELAAIHKGTLLASSMYENTEIMLKVKCGHETKGPVLFLEFDGVMNQGAQEKLESFLYYID